MVNEFQAYVLQRTAGEWAPFFRSRVMSRSKDGESLTWLTEYLGAARVLEALVRDLYGVTSGNVSRVITP
jgi:hypothetical protein